jgi:hypothetical protein
MLHSFPKARPPLPDEIQRIYHVQRKENREGRSPASSLSQKVEAWLHRQVARDVRADRSARATLEIGAGTLNQLRFEPDVGPYDIVEPLRDMYEGSPLLARIRHVYSDIAEVPDTARYDRVTAIATFEHICNLPEVIARSGLLLTEHGTLRVSIPSEGTVIWALGWRLTTGLEFRLRHGLDYGDLLRHEHVNSAREIEALLRYFLRDVRARVFGMGRRLSLYQFYECAHPDAGRCRDYLTTAARRSGLF